MDIGHEGRSPTNSPSPGQSAEWRTSVQLDLYKACCALLKAHSAEAEANMAVFLAEVSYDTGVAGASAVAKQLKELHVAAMQGVNESEERVREVIEGDTTFGPVYNSTISVYAQGLTQRSEALYKCHTETLATRHLVATRARKLEACKRHLVKMVADRTNAEVEVERISGLYVENTMCDNLLEEQLTYVRNGAVDATKERHNAHAHFAKDLAKHRALFEGNLLKYRVTPSSVPNPPPHEEHDAQGKEVVQEVVQEVVHEAVRGLVERVVQVAEYTGHDVYA